MRAFYDQAITCLCAGSASDEISGVFGRGSATVIATEDAANLFYLALAVHQLLLKVVALQWIFAFVIMALLFVLTMGVAVPSAFGKQLSLDRDEPIQDEEQAPLLRDE